MTHAATVRPEPRDNGIIVIRQFDLDNWPMGWRRYSANGTPLDQGQCGWDHSLDNLAAECACNVKFAPLDDAYLRFKPLPSCGKSRNHITGKLESGVSVYSLVWDYAKGCWIIDSTGHSGALIINAIMGSEMYIVTGSQCGTGSDGEPVIKDAKVFSRAKWDDDKCGITIA